MLKINYLVLKCGLWQAAPMRQNKLKNLLENYNAPSIFEENCKRQMLSLEAHSDCLERSCLEGHFTASSFLLDQTAQHFLLLHHRKLNLWLQPGGHADGVEDLLEVAIREAQEETGILGIAAVSSEIFDLDIHTIPANKSEPAHQHYDLRFLLQVTTDAEIIPNAESKAIAWFELNPAKLPTQEHSILRMLAKFLVFQAEFCS